MVIWTVLDLCNLILSRAGGAGLTALHYAQLFRYGFDIAQRRHSQPAFIIITIMKLVSGT
jgi:hypothetical protein